MSSVPFFIISHWPLLSCTICISVFSPLLWNSLSPPSWLTPVNPSLMLSHPLLLWQEPYLQSVCECCSYRLDPDHPVRFLSLWCESGESEPVVLPVIHSCECTSCQGGEWRVWSSGFACASLMSTREHISIYVKTFPWDSCLQACSKEGEEGICFYAYKYISRNTLQNVF